MQRAVVSDNFLSGVVSPALTWANFFDGGQQLVGPLNEAGGAHADDAGVLALGLECKQVVKGGDSVDPAGRQLQAAGHIEQHVEFEEAEQFLRLVQHLDQRVGLVLHPLHGGVEDLEALVAAGVGVRLNRLHSETPSPPPSPGERGRGRSFEPSCRDRNPCAGSGEGPPVGGARRPRHAESKVYGEKTTSSILGTLSRGGQTSPSVGGRSRPEACDSAHFRPCTDDGSLKSKKWISLPLPHVGGENKAINDAGPRAG